MGEWLLSRRDRLSSQARSAWVAMQRGPVPEGRLRSLSVPKIFVAKLSSPRFNRPAGTKLFS
jgi:hypothetical protein